MRDLCVACFKEEGAFGHSLCLTCSSMAQIKQCLEKLLVITNTPRLLDGSFLVEKVKSYVEAEKMVSLELSSHHCLLY